MVTVEFTRAEAQAAAEAVLAYIDDDYYPAIDLEALRTAYRRLTSAIAPQPTAPRPLRPGRRP